MMKTARVTQVDRIKGLLKVEIPEEQTESGWLALASDAYDLPPIGSQVKVTFEQDDFSAGLCHGRYFNANDMPQQPEENSFYQRMAGHVVIRYQAADRSLHIEADRIVISGDVSIAGSVEIGGSLHVAGQITEGTP